MSNKVKRIGAGEYTVSNGQYVVEVTKVGPRKWTAQAQWDRAKVASEQKFIRAKRMAVRLLDSAINDEIRRTQAAIAVSRRALGLE